jgi:hypothetical protein
MSALSPALTEPAITFWGAAASVSGSLHVVDAGPRKILLDCGLHQGKREEARERERPGRLGRPLPDAARRVQSEERAPGRERVIVQCLIECE